MMKSSIIDARFATKPLNLSINGADTHISIVKSV